MCRAVCPNRSARAEGVSSDTERKWSLLVSPEQVQHFRWSAGSSGFGFNPVTEVRFRRKQGLTQVYAFQLDSPETAGRSLPGEVIRAREKSTWTPPLPRWAVRPPDGRPLTGRVTDFRTGNPVTESPGVLRPVVWPKLDLTGEALCTALTTAAEREGAHGGRPRGWSFLVSKHCPWPAEQGNGLRSLWIVMALVLQKSDCDFPTGRWELSHF